MKVLLCAATEMEIGPTLQDFSIKHPGYADVVITGVGMMAASYAITKAIVRHQPEFIIQAGIAGTLEYQLQLGTVVLVKNETIGDLGVEEELKFQSVFDIKLLNHDIHPWKNRLLHNDHDLLDTIGLPLVNGVTVNEISTNQERINYYRKELNAQIETMEGAALHYVGLMEKIPFLQIRSVSNFIGERDKSKWVIKEAIWNLNHELQKLLTKYILP